MSLRYADREIAAPPSLHPPAPTLRLIAEPSPREMKPPVVLLGGEANALSVARDLSPMGVKVVVVSTADSCLRYSRHCRVIVPPPRGTLEQSWSRYLLGRGGAHLTGSVLLACSDAGLQLLASHRHALQQRYLLDEADPRAQLAMLDKLQTYQQAAEAGIATPKFWVSETTQQIIAQRHEYRFPLLVKPRISHVFEQRFGRKFVIAHSFDELLAAFEIVAEAGITAMLVEWIPGPDHLLASYFTYVDAEGKPLFDYTKRVIRRYPVGMGAGCYHITDWVPEILEPSRLLIRQASLRGLVNIEFKFDERDQTYKLMECNARFTASNSLVSASGLALAPFIYNRIIGQPQLMRQVFKLNMRMWDPIRDCAAFLELRRKKEITLGGWLKSILHPQTLPYFCWSDPGPTVARALRPVRRMLRKSAK
jgi:D-aspartate ligase